MQINLCAAHIHSFRWASIIDINIDSITETKFMQIKTQCMARRYFESEGYRRIVSANNSTIHRHFVCWWSNLLWKNIIANSLAYSLFLIENSIKNLHNGEHVSHIFQNFTCKSISCDSPSATFSSHISLNWYKLPEICTLHINGFIYKENAIELM